MLDAWVRVARLTVKRHGGQLVGAAQVAPKAIQGKDAATARRRGDAVDAVTLSLGALGVVLAAGLNLGQFSSLPLLLLMFAAMYFLLIAPNQKKQKQWQAQLSALKLGDRVTTSGGLRGTVVSLKDDAVVVKTQPDGVKFEIVKTAIAAVTTEDVART